MFLRFSWRWNHTCGVFTMDLSFPCLLPPLTPNSPNFNGNYTSTSPHTDYVPPELLQQAECRGPGLCHAHLLPKFLGLPFPALHRCCPSNVNFPRKIPAPGPPKGRCVSLGPALPWTIDTRTKRLQKAEFWFRPVLPLPCCGTGRCGVNSGAQVCLQPLPGPSRNAPSHILPLEHGQGGTATPGVSSGQNSAFPCPRSHPSQGALPAKTQWRPGSGWAGEDQQPARGEIPSLLKQPWFALHASPGMQTAKLIS